MGMNNDYSDLLGEPGATARSGIAERFCDVSIVIPTYNRKRMLARTLAGLTHQTYPLERVEVVIADDGSDDGVESVVKDFEGSLDLVHVRQAHRAYRLAAVCNLGIRASRHSAIVLLQCDMIPDPGLTSAYMHILENTDDAVLLGTRRFIAANQLSPADILADAELIRRAPAIATNNEMWPNDSRARVEDWRGSLYRRTNNLVDAMWPFQACVGSNLAFRRSLAVRIGGFCEEFHDWGGEDGEFGYRAYNAGCFFIPVRDAVAFHQEPPGGVNETNRAEGAARTALLREQKCALPPYRKGQESLGFDVPKVSVCIVVGDPGALANCLASLADQTYRDAEIIVSGAGDWPGRPDERFPLPVRWLDDQQSNVGSALSRAIVASRGPYLLVLHADFHVSRDLVRRLVHRLDNENIGAVVSSEARPGGHQALILRKRDWSRLPGLLPDLPRLDYHALTVALTRVCIVKTQQE